MDQASLAEKPSLTLQRKYAAPPEAVWRAWTTPEALKQWWGPGSPQAVSVVELDLRVGGRFRICFGGPQGNDHECARKDGAGTELVFRHEQLFDQAAADGHKRGWTETLQKLEGFLQS